MQREKVQLVKTKSQCSQFLNENELALRLFTFARERDEALPYKYWWEIASMVLALYPDCYCDVEGILNMKIFFDKPGAKLKREHYSIFLTDKIVSIPDIEDTLFGIIFDEEMIEFNKNPKETMTRLSKQNKEHKMEMAKQVFFRILEEFNKILDFDIPGYGALRSQI